MKGLLKNLMVVVLTLLVLGCTSGDGDGDPDPIATEEAFAKLAGQWTFGSNGEGSIVVDGTDASRNYPGFSLSFADGTYQTQNAGSLFSASGTWEWADEEARQLQIDSGETITLLELTETRFRFSFISDGSIAYGIAGNYTITVVK